MLWLTVHGLEQRGMLTLRFFFSENAQYPWSDMASQSRNIQCCRGILYRPDRLLSRPWCYMVSHSVERCDEQGAVGYSVQD